MRIVFALLCTLIGLTLVFGGYRLARIIIPLWGFLAGLSLGGAVVSAMDGTPFLGATLGILAGLFGGIVMALLAYLYYGAAVIIATGMLGYWLGSGFIQLFGFEPGFLSTFTGIVLGVLAGFLALLADAPKYVLVVITAVAGAVASVGGILLLFNVIPLEYFNYAVAHAAISNSFLWTLVTITLAAVGMIWQARSTSHYNFVKWAAGDETNHLTPSTPSWNPH